jgi:hypothetical protein
LRKHTQKEKIAKHFSAHNQKTKTTQTRMQSTEDCIQLNYKDQNISLNRRAVPLSKVIIEGMEDVEEGGSVTVEVKLENVNIPFEYLKKVVEYLHLVMDSTANYELHKGSSIPMSSIVPKEELDFIRQFNEHTVQPIIVIADYFNCKRLLDLSCAHMAYCLRGYTPDEIIVFFNIHVDPVIKKKFQSKPILVDE